MYHMLHWFYCLPVPGLLIGIISVTAFFLWFRENYRATRFWRPTMWGLFLFVLAVILYATLGHRSEYGNRMEPQLIPLYSYYLVLHGGNPEIFRSNFMNVLLFCPIGLLGCELLPRECNFPRKLLAAFAGGILLGVTIEYCQYSLALGLAETDDVIHNTTGALLGALASEISLNKLVQQIHLWIPGAQRLSDKQK